jgi:hypothetical protein
MAITNTALATAMSDLIAHWQDFQDEHQDWLAGTVGGGPNSDGKYPLTDYEDNTVLVTCPAQLEADIDALVDAGTGAVADAEAAAAAAAASQSAAATSATNAATSASTATTQATNASNSASAAASSAAVALAQAGAAATSATNAAASETAAELAETNAETAETNAAASAAAAAASAAAAATFNPALYATLAGSQTFTGEQTISAATPKFIFYETDQAADEKGWSIRASGGLFRVATRTDAGVDTSNFISVTRSGTTVTEIELNATALDFNADMDVSGAVNLQSTLTIGGVTEFASTLPIVRWKDTDAGSNEKNWLWYASGTSMILATATDASPGVASSSVMTITRSGTTPGTVSFAGTEANITRSGGDPRWHLNDGTVTGSIQIDSTNDHVQVGSHSAHALRLFTNNSHRITVSSVGGVQFNAFGAGTLVTDGSGNISPTSDERLKQAIVPFNRGLDAILAINPIRYRWTPESGMESHGTYAGFSAQNVQSAIPEAVGQMPGPEGYRTLMDRPILAALVNAIKELNDKIEALEAA